MAKVFLDANVFIHLVERQGTIDLDDINNQLLFISPLSIHILHYVAKKKVPYESLLRLMQEFTVVPFDQEVWEKAMIGPTSDFEDNVQLHSAAETGCDIFLTQDKQLLSLAFFGKMRLVSGLPQQLL